MRTALAALLALSACGGGSTPTPTTPTGGATATTPPPPPASAAAPAPCGPVVAKLTASMGPQLAQSMPADKASKWAARLTEVMTASCDEDGWPESIKTCVMDAKTDEAVNACGDGAKADPNLEAKMMARLQPVMTEMMQDMGGGPPANEPDPGTVVPPPSKP